MRLIFVCEHYYPEIGGLEHSTHRLAKALISRGHSVTVLAPVAEGIQDSSIYDGVPVERSQHGTCVAFTASGKSRSFLGACDAVCVFGIGDDQKALLWQPVFDLSGTPCFLKIGTAGDTEKKGVPPDLIRKFTGVFCQNDAIAEECRALGFGEDKCIRIQNGLDVTAWNVSIKNILSHQNYDKASKRKFTVSAIGRFVTRKRFPVIIDSFIRFTSSLPSDEKPNLLLHGSDFGQSDGEESLIVTMAEAAVRDGIPIHVVGPDIKTAFSLAASDASIAMGTREGAPNIILESLATGVPVIASDIPGHDLYITHKQHGYLCKAQTDDELRSDIVRGLLWARTSSHTRIVKDACIEKAFTFDIAKTSAEYERHLLQFVAS